MLLLFRFEAVFKADLNPLFLGACAEETVAAFRFDLVDLAGIALRHAPLIREYSIGVGLEIFQDRLCPTSSTATALGRFAGNRKITPDSAVTAAKIISLARTNFFIINSELCSTTILH